MNEIRELITLSDGRAGLRSQLEATVSPGDGGPAVLEFRASNRTLDRYREIIEPEGWRLDNYRRNPVFQNAHQYGDIIFTLGKALVTEVRDGSLFQRIQFAVEENPLARISYNLYRGGFLNAVSVGFVPVRWETGSEKTEYRRRYLEQELLEVSAVAIPANPDALMLGMRAGAVGRSELAELLEVFVSALRADQSEAQRKLFEFARTLRTAMTDGPKRTTGRESCARS